MYFYLIIIIIYSQVQLYTSKYEKVNTKLLTLNVNKDYTSMSDSTYPCTISKKIRPVL